MGCVFLCVCVCVSFFCEAVKELLIWRLLCTQLNQAIPSFLSNILALSGKDHHSYGADQVRIIPSVHVTCSHIV